MTTVLGPILYCAQGAEFVLAEDTSHASQAMKVAHDDAMGAVLVVAEKPSVAKAIAEVLSGGRKRTRRCARAHIYV